MSFIIVIGILYIIGILVHIGLVAIDTQQSLLSQGLWVPLWMPFFRVLRNPPLEIFLSWIGVYLYIRQDKNDKLF